MPISLASLQKLSNMALTSEQMAGVIGVLAVELAPIERIREQAATRQSRYRKRDNNVEVTSLSPQNDVTVTSSRVLDNTILTSKQKERKKETPTVPLFDDFWDSYPKRLGPADKKAAFKAFSAALKRETAENIIIGSKAYSSHCKATCKIGTEYVKQARTWLNGDGWAETYSGATIFASAGLVKPQVPVYENTEAWAAWQQVRKSPCVDIRIDGEPIRQGWWFPTEFPNT